MLHWDVGVWKNFRGQIMLNSSSRESSRTGAKGRHPVLEQMPWDERVQLAELATALREYHNLRSGTYMYRASFCTLDSLGQPLIVIETGSEEAGLTSRRVVTFGSAGQALEFVALKATSGLMKAKAWRKSFPAPAMVADETFELAPAQLEDSARPATHALQ
jgi:hypothetical protein